MAQTPDELIVTLGNLATYHDLNKVSYIDGREMLCFGDVSGIDNEEEPEEEYEIQEEPQIEEDNLLLQNSSQIKGVSLNQLLNN